MRRFSIIIPVRNESSLIVASLSALETWRRCGHEVIVVDGNSSDLTAALAGPLCDRIIRTKPGRASQMNIGAAAATGDLLLFLHVDSILPDNVEAELNMLADDATEFWGRFDVRLDADRLVYRIIEALINWRSRITGIATGDQAIFVSRRLFKRCGGFPSIALMEDIALSGLLRCHVRPVCIKSKLVTSARRWQTNGVVKTVLTMWFLRAAYYFGVPPARLRTIYEARATTNG